MKMHKNLRTSMCLVLALALCILWLPGIASENTTITDPALNITAQILIDETNTTNTTLQANTTPEDEIEPNATNASNTTKPVVPVISQPPPEPTVPFDIEIATNNEMISKGEEFILAINTTIMNVRIYSLSAAASITLPDGTEVPLENANISERDSTLFYKYILPEWGTYRYDVTMYFEDEEYSIGDTFTIDENATRNIQITTNTTNASQNTSINASLDMNNTNTSTLENATKKPRLTDVVLEPKTQASNAELLAAFINETGISLGFDMAETYLYEYGPIIVNGSINIPEELYGMNLTMHISPVDNLKHVVTCSFEVNTSQSFFCELPNSQIEIADYEVQVIVSLPESARNITLDGELDHAFKQYFALDLASEEDITLHVDHETFVESGDLQTFVLEATDSNGAVTGADVGLRIKDPKGQFFTAEAKEKRPGMYHAEFKGITPGVYSVEFFVVKGTQYKSIETQYRILEKNIALSLDVPESILHTYGTLNVSGTLRLTKNDNFFDSDVDISIKTDSGLKAGCIVYCDGYCDFTCPVEHNIEFTTYNITASIMDDLLEYSDSKIFTVGFDYSNITLDVQHADEYYLEEEQIFLIAPKVYDEYLLDEGVVFVEITDPSGIVYKFVPEEVVDGYSFSFIGITPGRYTANVTFIQDGFYASKQISYTVKNESYYDVVSDEKELWERETKKKIAEQLSRKELADFVTSNETDLYIQLPARVGEPVQWIKISKGRKVIFDKRSSNIDNTVMQKLLEKHYDMYKSYNLSDFIETNYSNLDLAYLETERVRRSEFDLSASKKEVHIVSNYAYKDITTDLSLLDIGEAPPDRILLHAVENESRVSVRNVSYYDDNGNGLIDRIAWSIPEIASTPETSELLFEVEVLIDNTSFAVDELDFVHQYELARFRASFRNPDINVLDVQKSGNGCYLEIDGLQHEMAPDPSQQVFEVVYEFENVGRYDYKIFCGDNVIRSSIQVLPTDDLLLKRSRSSRSYFYDDLHYVTEVTSQPENFVEQGVYKRIDTEFIPKIDAQNNVYYKVDRGLYGTKLGYLDTTHPFSYDYKNNELNFSIVGIAYYSMNVHEAHVIIPASANATPVRDGNTIHYYNIFPDSELRFTYEPTRLKEEIILSDALRLPRPEDIGFDPDQTMVVLLYDMDLGNYVLDQQISYDDFYVRTAAYEDTGIMLPKDMYAPISNPENYHQMLRIVQKNTTYQYMTGLPYTDYLRLNEPIIIDPTFSISPTNRDGMSIDDQTRTDYYAVSSPYLFVGSDNGEVYKAGLQFTIDIPDDATITSAFITVVPGTNTSGGTFTSNISIEDTDNTLPYSAGLGNISGRTYWGTTAEWTMDAWDTAYNYSTPNLASLIQHVIDRPGFSSGNSIGFMIDEGDASNAYRSFHDYSSPGTNAAMLTLVYLSSESRPIIELHSPANDTMTTNTTLDFTFIPTDAEGLDTCQLWANFTGVWAQQAALSAPANATLATFADIAVPNGNFIWNVWCNDTMGNSRFNTTDYELFIDDTDPFITLHNPADDSIETAFATTFNWSITDVSSDLTCNLSYYEQNNDVLYFKNNIAASNTGFNTQIESDLPVGSYLWNVTCVDLLGNTNTSETSRFNMSRNTTLAITSDVELEMNYTIYHNITFYANYSLANTSAINDGTCIISFNDSVSDTMVYDAGTSFFTYSRVFGQPYYYSYDVSCTHLLYDGQIAYGSFYIYPLINASIIKEVRRSNLNQYNITLTIGNRLNTSAYVRAYDFIHSAFTPSFDQAPDATNAVTGGFFGNSYYWEYFMTAGEQRNITYDLTHNVDDFYVRRLYIVGLSSFGE